MCNKNNTCWYLKCIFHKVPLIYLSRVCECVCVTGTHACSRCYGVAPRNFFRTNRLIGECWLLVALRCITLDALITPTQLLLCWGFCLLTESAHTQQLADAVIKSIPPLDDCEELFQFQGSLLRLDEISVAISSQLNFFSLPNIFHCFTGIAPENTGQKNFLHTNLF